MASEIDGLIRLADGYNDFVLGALLCTVRHHLEQAKDEEIPPSS